MEDSAQQPREGNTAQRVTDALLSTLRNRIELFALDLQEERLWLVSTFIWVSVSLFFGFASLIVITFTAVEFSPVNARPYVFLGFSLLYLATTISAVAILRRKLKEKPPPFADTIAELKKDLSCLRSQD